LIGPAAKDAIPTLENLTGHEDKQIAAPAKAALRQVRGPLARRKLWTQVQVPHTIVDGLDTDELALQRYTDEHKATVPLHPPVGADSPYLEPVRVLMLRNRLRHGTRREVVELGWHAHVERFMRTLFIVDDLKSIE
jgi:hypothetical protein